MDGPLNKVGHVYTSLNTFLQVWTYSGKLDQFEANMLKIPEEPVCF